VITGTWVVYPWYRESGPSSPKAQLLANPDTKDWHEFGMEWKEHIAWDHTFNTSWSSSTPGLGFRDRPSTSPRHAEAAMSEV
jgi:hypothetical protein